MQPSITHLWVDTQAFIGHALPSQRNRAGQRIVLGIEDVIRQPRAGRAIVLLYLLFLGDGLGLARQELPKAASSA